MEYELIPCPFCGGELILDVDDEFGGAGVFHRHNTNCIMPEIECIDDMPIGSTIDDLVKRINTRPIEDALRADLSALKKSYNEEVDQLNDGITAGEEGGLDPFDDAPHYEPDYDTWRLGYYAGSYDRLTADLADANKRLEDATGEIEHLRDTRQDPYDRIEVLQADLAALRERTEGVCKWTLEDDDWGTWQTGCGAVWSFPSGSSPEENEMNYCPICGKHLVQIEPGQPEEK